jgi:uncharacterized membrane protein YagU involved in acid resistance
MSRLYLSALLASVAAGIPDVFVAAALSRASPGKVLQLIASGVLGEASYTRGSMSIALGLGLQIAMSFVIALIYNLAFSRVPGLRHSPFIFGALYGVTIFVVMNFVVVPLSRSYPKHHWDLKSIVAMLVVMILFAEIISFIATAFAE